MSIFNSKQNFSDAILRISLEQNHFLEYILMFFNSEKSKLKYDRFNMMKSIYNYHKKHPSEHMDVRFYETLLEIAKKYPGEAAISGVLENIKCQLYFEKQGKATFKIDCREILNALKVTILANKNMYTKKTEFFEKPFWSTIQGYDKDLFEEYGYKVL